MFVTDKVLRVPRLCQLAKTGAQQIVFEKKNALSPRLAGELLGHMLC